MDLCAHACGQQQHGWGIRCQRMPIVAVGVPALPNALEIFFHPKPQASTLADGPLSARQASHGQASTSSSIMPSGTSTQAALSRGAITSRVLPRTGSQLFPPATSSQSFSSSKRQIGSIGGGAGQQGVGNASQQVLASTGGGTAGTAGAATVRSTSRCGRTARTCTLMHIVVVAACTCNWLPRIKNCLGRVII